MTVKKDGITLVDNGGSSGTAVDITAVGGVPVTSPLPVTFVPSGLPQDVNLMEVGGVAFDLGQEFAVGSLPVVIALDQSSIPVVVGPGSGILVLNSGGASAVNIQDGGNSITVDGPLTDTQLRATPVPVSGTVSTGGLTDTQLRATPVPISAANLDVALSTRLAESTFTTRINTQGQKAMAASTPVVIASDQSAVPVSGTVTITPSGVQNVQGNVAHDTTVSTNQPVSISAVSQDMDSSAPPNRVNAEADVTRVSSDRDGAVFTHPHGPQIENYHENSSSQLTDQQVFASAGSGLSHYITDIVVSTGAATAFNIFFEEGSTIVLGPYYLEAVNGRGVCIHFQTPKKLTAATALTVTTSAAIAHSIEVNGFIAP